MLSDVFHLTISSSTVRNRLEAAAQSARAINTAQDLSLIEGLFNQSSSISILMKFSLGLVQATPSKSFCFLEKKHATKNDITTKTIPNSLEIYRVIPVS